MAAARPHRNAESGAILIQVAIASLLLIAFTMFVVDYGIMWVSRNQAQNAADAGALAGAVALAFDDADDRSDTGPAKLAARNLALSNDVWGEDPDVQMTDIRFYPDDPSLFPAECADDSCIRVDVYRNQERGNPLPMWFGALVGLFQQGVRASAIAWAGAGNASDCMKPWGVADKWLEQNPTPGPWTPTSTYDPTGPTPDIYTPPSGDDPGTGFTVEDDLGTEMRLKVGQPKDAINPGWFQALDLSPDAGGGAAEYESYISGCSPHIWKIGDEIPKKTGNMVGPTRQGTLDLIAKDPYARFEGGQVVDSAYETSPRIVAIPIFDLDYYMATGGPGNGTVRVVNILGFFVDRVENPQSSVVGYLVNAPALKVAGAGEVPEEASFVKVIQLVR